MLESDVGVGCWSRILESDIGVGMIFPFPFPFPSPHPFLFPVPILVPKRNNIKTTSILIVAKINIIS